MRLTLLGTGNAAQVPVYNCLCVACERARADPGYRRGPCCALLTAGGQQWLIDAGLTDLATRFAPGQLTGIIQTHYHADHAQGLLHLRWGINMRLPVLGPHDPDGLADLYKHPGILDFSGVLAPFVRHELMPGLALIPVPLTHSKPTLGYVFEHQGRRLAYLTDTAGLPDDTARFLAQAPVDAVVLDCSYPPQAEPPRNHNDLVSALASVAGLSAGKVVLTHIGHQLDAWLMAQGPTLPGHVQFAYDGMCIGEC